jgi:hypothetical protein
MLSLLEKADISRVCVAYFIDTGLFVKGMCS